MKVIVSLVALFLTVRMACADPLNTNTVSTSAPSMKTEEWTVNGKDYHNVVVGQIDADRVHITYDGGIGTVMLSDLSPDLQKRFNYDPAAAKAASDERAKQAAQSDAMVVAATQQQAKADATQAKIDKRQANSDANAPKAKRIAELQTQIAAMELQISSYEQSLNGHLHKAGEGTSQVSDWERQLNALRSQLADARK